MVWFVVMQVFSTLLEWVRVGRRTEQEKDLEILLLRKQLAIMERKRDKPKGANIYAPRPLVNIGTLRLFTPAG